LGEDAFQQVNQPQTISGQRVAALRFTDRRVHALSCALLAFRLLPCGFANHELRALLAPLLGLNPHHFTQGQMTYHLRRLRLHGLIERIPDTHRYQVTEFGWRVAFFSTHLRGRNRRLDRLIHISFLLSKHFHSNWWTLFYIRHYRK